LTVLARRTTSVCCARAYADASCNVADGLVGDFTAVGLTVGIGGTSLADTALHAVVTGGSSAVGINHTSSDTKTSAEVAVRLSWSLSSIE
jgi:hypothetical protein